MRRWLIAVFLLSGTSVAGCSSEHPAAGRWRGTIMNTETDLTLAIENGIATGSLTNRRGDRVNAAQVSGSALRDSVALILSLPGETEAGSIDAAVRGDSLVGLLRGSGERIPVAFHRLAAE